MKVVNDLFLYLSIGSMSILALFDLSSAFDTFDHCILVHCLHTHFRFIDTRLFSKASEDKYLSV